MYKRYMSSSTNTPLLAMTFFSFPQYTKELKIKDL
jgi:hypothetical protein